MAMNMGVVMAPTMYAHTPEQYIRRWKRGSPRWNRGQCSLDRQIWKWPCRQQRQRGLEVALEAAKTERPASGPAGSKGRAGSRKTAQQSMHSMQLPVLHAKHHGLPLCHMQPPVVHGLRQTRLQCGSQPVFRWLLQV